VPVEDFAAVFGTEFNIEPSRTEPMQPGWPFVATEPDDRSSGR
jgi:hypothetical protein